MAERISLGGKGSSLSSSSVFDTAIAITQIYLDSSALARLSSSSNSNKHMTKHKIVIPNFLTQHECRASLIVLLNKLLLSGSSNVRTVLPELISQTLNSNPASLEFDELELTEEELYVVKNCSSVLLGVAAILDRKVEALSGFADGAAAVSCEALKTEVTAFNFIDSGDGHTGKEEVGVAGDMKVLLNGSQLVGKAKLDSVSKIPKVHGSIRNQVKQVHAITRVELNSGVNPGTDESVKTVLSSMASGLVELGRCSLSRGKSNLASIGNETLRSRLEGIFEKQCLVDGMCLSNRVLSELVLEEDNDKYAHKVNELLEMVWKIVVLEAITGYISLEGIELSEEGQDVQVNGENVKAERKSDKKKKVVLGKGTSVILQKTKERLQNLKIDAGRNLELLEKWVDGVESFFNLKDPEFRNFLVKLKEIVESNESRRLPKLPKGTRDFAKEQMATRKLAFSIIEEVFERHGATALDTPVFELRETLMGKYGEDSKLIYDLADQGGELCSLRYDLTVPFARFVAMNGITSLKRYQIAKVYRRDNPSKGRYREFYQCDFDVAGQYEKMGPDFEVVRILTELLDELQIGDYEVKLNHRRLLDGMLEICGVPSEKFRAICSSIDKLDKQSFDQVKREMVGEKGLSVETADKIGEFVKERGPPLELLNKLKQEGSKFLGHEGSTDALNDLDILFSALEKSKKIDRIVFDLSLARGLDYYTGVIFEAVFKGGTQVGSIAAGGRYDNLIGMFGNKQVPSVGASLGIERVFAIMEQLHKDQNQTPRATKTEVLVSILGDNLSQASELVSELWDAKVKAEFLVNKKIKKHIDRAVESRIPWMVIQGERELSEGIVKLKDVEAAKEETLPRSQIVDEIKKRLNR